MHMTVRPDTVLMYFFFFRMFFTVNGFQPTSLVPNHFNFPLLEILHRISYVSKMLNI